MSNCNRHRYLIQQKFDTDLTPQDERSIVTHMEQCESCAKFHHQLQQVIMAAEEVPLPEEMQPPNPEALARTIMEQLPQSKSSPFAFLTSLFSAFKGKDAPTRLPQRNSSSFPHRKAAVIEPEQADTGGSKARAGKKDRVEEEGVETNRLKSMSRMTSDFESREAQSKTSSLGEKFGMAPPPSQADDQPLTLAESIRRKISENKDDGSLPGAVFGSDNPDAAAPPPPKEDSWGKPSALPNPKMPANMADPPVLPGKAAMQPTPSPMPGGSPPPVLGSWGKPSPLESSPSWGPTSGGGAGTAMKEADSFGAAASAGGPLPHPPQPAQPAMAAPVWGAPTAPAAPQGQGSWDDPPKGAGGEEDAGWGPPPAGGAWDEPNASWGTPAGQTPAPASQPMSAPLPAPPVPPTGNAWAGTPPAASVPNPPAPAPSNESWGGQGGQGAQPAAGGNLKMWGQPGQPPSIAPAPAQAQPAQPSAASWGQPQSDWTSPAESSSPPTTTSWGQPSAADGWGQGASKETTAPKPAGWGAPDAPAWGQPETDSKPAWGQPSAPPAPAPPPAPVPPPTPAPALTTGGAAVWGQTGGVPGATPQPAHDAGKGGWAEGAAAEAAKPAWGQPAPQPASSAQPAWGQPGAPAEGQAWGQTPAQDASKGGWGQSGTTGDAWGQPAGAPAQGPAQAWGQQTTPSTQAWGNPQESWGQQGDSAAQKRADDRKPSWSLEAEQIETGTWKAFTPSGETLGAKAPAGGGARAWQPEMPPPPQPGGGQSFAPTQQQVDDANRWDLPIQERMKLQQQQATSAAAGAPVFPTPPPPPLPAPPVPPQPAAPVPPKVVPQPPQGAVQPTAKAHAEDERPTNTKSGWNFPVFESPEAITVNPEARIPDAQLWDLPQSQEGAAPAPSGTMTDPARNLTSGNAWAPKPQDWGQPGAEPGQAQPPAAPPAALPGAGWGASSQSSASNPNRWDVPIQERQAAPTPPPAPAPAPAPAPSVSSWGTAPAIAPVPTPQPQALPAAQPAAAGAGQPGGLFQSFDDNAIDRLFSENLGVAGERGPTAPPPPAAAVPAPPAAPAPLPHSQPAQAPSSLFSNPWGNPEPAPAPVQAPAPNPFPPAPAMPSASPPPFGSMAQAAQAAQADQAPRITAVTPRQTGQPAQPPMPSADRRSSGFTAPPPPVPAAQPALTAVGQAAALDDKAGLFNLDDSAMDKLFAENLGVKEAVPGNRPATPPAPQPPAAYGAPAPSSPFVNQAASFAAPTPTPQAPPNPFGALNAPAPAPTPPQSQGSWGQAPAPTPMPGAAPAAAAAQEQAAGGGLFAITDSVIDRIFADNLGIKDQPMPAIKVNEAVRTLSEAVSQVQAPVPPPKIEGVGRLDARTDTQQESGSGRIASIGKFLLDQKDLEKIGKITGSDLSDTKMRILTLEAAGELQTLLQHIGAQEKVVGSVIVGHDGLLIANTMPSDLDAESIGVWALGVYMNTEHVIKKMGQDRVHQIVSRTPKGYLVIADFGGGLLVTVSDGKDTDTLIPLMRSITQLVAQ